jgi:methanogenic corrinoid protein MtbC1
MYDFNFATRKSVYTGSNAEKVRLYIAQQKIIKVITKTVTKDDELEMLVNKLLDCNNTDIARLYQTYLEQGTENMLCVAKKLKQTKTKS